MIIDIFSHHISVSVGKLIEKGKYFGEGRQYYRPIQNADPEVRLNLMEKYGIDVQALSQTTPVLMGFGPEDAAEICRLSNDDNYALCKAYPDRFVDICIISLLDMGSAMKELDRSINELDCRGVTVSSTCSRIFPASPSGGLICNSSHYTTNYFTAPLPTTGTRD